VIRIVVPGRPVPKGRPRIQIRGRGRNLRAHAYTPPETREYEERVRDHARMAAREPLSGPVHVRLVFWVSGRRPDLDNCIKSALDGLCGAALVDDRQVVRIEAAMMRARRRDEERAEIVIRRVEEETA